MTRVNRVDSLASELREIKRRLHALETALGVVTTKAVTTATAAAVAAATVEEKPGSAAGEPGT
jgi:hypothetical protein